MSARKRSCRASLRPHRAHERGFTLTELMAAVAITGILSTIAIAAFHKRALESNVTHAKVIIKAIAVAEEHYRAENQVYLDVSAPDVATEGGWYPHATIPVNKRWSFWRKPKTDVSDPETQRWRMLGPVIPESQSVEFVFKARAGLPAVTPTLDTTKISLPAASPVEPWYVIQARANADGDSVYCMVAAASWAPEIISVDDGE